MAALQGNGALAVTLAVYGNRAYEDALAELDDSVGKQGFRHLSSAALTAQHSIVTQLASGRPDQEDAEEIRHFANEILMKYERILSGSEQPDGYPVPGNRPVRTVRAQMPCGGNPGKGTVPDRSVQMFPLYEMCCHLPGKSKEAAGTGYGRPGTEAGPFHGNPREK